MACLRCLDCDFVKHNKIASDTLTGGPVKIDLCDGADPVVTQLWSEVEAVIAFSSDKMNDFLNALGVNGNEKSPFCRHFKSPEDLKDAFMKYSPCTFKYTPMSGTPAEGQGDEEPSNEDSVPEETEIETIETRMRKFAARIVAIEQCQNKTSIEDAVADVDSDIELVNENENTPPLPTNTNVSSVDSSKRPAKTTPSPYPLSKSVEKMLQCKSSMSLLDEVMESAAILDFQDRPMKGSTSHDRKAKSLLSRWFTSSSKSSNAGGSTNADNADDGSPLEIFISRGTLISRIATYGLGGTKVTKPFHYRVLALYDKTYNKFFLTGEKKKWRVDKAGCNEFKKFKLGIRMVKKDALGGYRDVCLNDTSEGFLRRDICRMIDGIMIEGVHGMLRSI